MLAAITHHKFSSPTWGEHEVRKLHAELAELGRLVTQAVAPGSARITGKQVMRVHQGGRDAEHELTGPGRNRT